MPVGDTGQLREFYDRLVAPETQNDGLIVNTVGGADDKWTNAQVGNLTYCVSNKFGTRKADIVNAMNGGAGLWEAAAPRINFVYVPSQDASCTTRNKAVVFSVEPVQTTQYIARAFFPSTPKRSRNVLVDDSIWTSGSWTPANILGHELGHTLGLPPRAHPARGRHLLRGQQLAPADAVRLGVDHALPAVQRLVEQPLA